MPPEHTPRRRTVLKLAGGIVGATVGTGIASAAGGELQTLEVPEPAPPTVTFESQIVELEGEFVRLYNAEYGPVGEGFPFTSQDRNFNDRFGRGPRPGDTVDVLVHNLEPDTEYEVRGVVEDDQGNVVTGSVVTFRTATGPVIEQFDFDFEPAPDGTGGSVTAHWTVSHEQDDLRLVQTAIGNGEDFFTPVETINENVSGGRASGTTRIESDEEFSHVTFDVWDNATGGGFRDDVIHGVSDDTDTDDGSDGGDTDDGSGDGGGGDSEPVIAEIDVSDRGNFFLDRFDVDWAVEDADGNLEAVTSELLDGSSVVDDASSDVDGSSASGTHTVSTFGGANEIRLVVTDADGHETTETVSV